MPSRARASRTSGRPSDPRFDTSQWSAAALGSTSKRPLVDDEGEDDETHDDNVLDNDDGGDDEDADSDSAINPIEPVAVEPIVKPLTREELEEYEAKQRKKGIIYISRIPYGMTVAKVRHLLSGFGDVERIYLQDGKEKERGGQPSRPSRASKSAHFTEGWVEFTSKKVAKTVADMLNAEPIGAASGGGAGGGKGGKRRSGGSMRRWKDEVWTMKYLSGFKWGMLSEQLANERASRASRVRAELSQSAYEQQDYLRKVERARAMRLQEQRRKEAAEDDTEQTAHAASAKRMRDHTFQQREALSRDVRDARPSSGDRAKKPRLATGPDDDRAHALQGALSKIF